MQTIEGFLEKYKDFAPPRLAAVRAVRAAVLEVLGIALVEKAIDVKKDRVVIFAGGLQKTEILLHKEEILAAIQAKLGSSIRNIR